MKLFRIAIVLMALVYATSSSAQITLDRYVPAPTQRDGFALSRPDHPEHLRLGAQMQLDYANEPLAWESRLGDSATAHEYPVKHQLTGHLMASLALFDRALVFIDIPLTLLMRGDRISAISPPDDFTLGNVRLGGRIRLLGEPDDLFALGIQASVALPSSHWASPSSSYSGERKFGGQGSLLAELRGERWRVSSSMGLRLRHAHIEDTIKVGNELLAAIGGGFTVVPGDTSLDLLLELYGSTVLRDFGDREGSPFEALLGAKVNSQSGVGAGAAGSLGLSHGYGSPTFRLIAMLGWLMPEDRDRDKDGIQDKLDRCPDEPEDRDAFEDEDGCPDPDNDKDGVLDRVDQCPLEAEDPDEFEDADGCPEPDNDKDGLLDNSDACRLEPEDLDSFQDQDGCPDPDNDDDGVLDAQDKCPTELEDRDGYRDDDGCPDPDNDGDSVLDAVDACPLEAETVNGREDEDGCPDLIRIDRDQKQIFILEPVRFAKSSATILSASFEMLREIAEALKVHTDITSVRIEGHTDSQGRDDKNQLLSEQRAISVLEFLVREGVEASRLTAKGFGESAPIGDNETAEGRAKNRRVDFRL